MRTINSWSIPRRATDRLKESDGELGGALALVALVIAAIIIAAGFGG